MKLQNLKITDEGWPFAPWIEDEYGEVIARVAYWSTDSGATCFEEAVKMESNLHEYQKLQAIVDALNGNP